MCVGAALAMAFAGGCKSDSDDGGGDDGADGGTGMMTTGPTTADGSTGPMDCVLGTENCGCLNGACGMGQALFCVEDVCVLGPELNPPDPFDVIAGVRVPLEVDAVADTFMWSQVDGPEAELNAYEVPQIIVGVPPDAPDNSTITLRMTSTRNGVESSADVVINVIPADFENFLGGITDPMELGTSEGLTFGNGFLWVASSEGFISRFGFDDMDGSPVFDASWTIGGSPMGIASGQIQSGDDNIDVVYIANAGAQELQSFTMQGGNQATVTSAVDGGGMLDAVSFVLPDNNNGDVFFSNGALGQLFEYDPDDGGTTTMLLDGEVGEIHSLAFGPDAGFIYVGAVGQVHRVPLLDTGAGPAELYLDLAPTTDPLNAVDGIAFDEGADIFVGIPGQSRLVMARFVAMGEAEITREWTNVGAGYSAFANLRFGGEDVFWTNLVDRTVGRLQVGLDGL